MVKLQEANAKTPPQRPLKVKTAAARAQISNGNGKGKVKGKKGSKAAAKPSLEMNQTGGDLKVKKANKQNLKTAGKKSLSSAAAKKMKATVTGVSKSPSSTLLAKKSSDQAPTPSRVGIAIEMKSPAVGGENAVLQTSQTPAAIQSASPVVKKKPKPKPTVDKTTNSAMKKKSNRNDITTGITVQTGFPLVKKKRSLTAKKPKVKAVNGHNDNGTESSVVPVPPVKQLKDKEASLIALKKKSSEKRKYFNQGFSYKPKDKRYRKGGFMMGEKRGVIVLSNIPHGFFEGEMERYFRQFGVLKNLRLVRSRKTGNSCGYAYIEFEHRAVAKIVANHMDGYLTFGKIMKCMLLPPEFVNNKLFRGKDIRPDNCPKLNARKGAINGMNRTRTARQEKKREERLMSTYLNKANKLQEMGVTLPLEILLGRPITEIKEVEKKYIDENEGETSSVAAATNRDTAPEEEKEPMPFSFSIPEDAVLSDVEPSEDVNLDLTEEEKKELNASREEMAAKIKHHIETFSEKKLDKEVAKIQRKQKRTTTATTTTPKKVMKITMDVDESEDEVALKTPPNTVKRYVKMGSSGTKSALSTRQRNTPSIKTKKGKVMPKSKEVKMTVTQGKKLKKLKEKNIMPLGKETKKEEEGEENKIKTRTPKTLTPKGVITPGKMKKTKQKEAAINTPMKAEDADVETKVTPQPQTPTAIVATPRKEKKVKEKVALSGMDKAEKIDKESAQQQITTSTLQMGIPPGQKRKKSITTADVSPFIDALPTPVKKKKMDETPKTTPAPRNNVAAATTIPVVTPLQITTITPILTGSKKKTVQTPCEATTNAPSVKTPKKKKDIKTPRKITITTPNAKTPKKEAAKTPSIVTTNTPSSKTPQQKDDATEAESEVATNTPSVKTPKKRKAVETPGKIKATTPTLKTPKKNNKYADKVSTITPTPKKKKKEEEEGAANALSKGIPDEVSVFSLTPMFKTPKGIKSILKTTPEMKTKVKTLKDASTKSKRKSLSVLPERVSKGKKKVRLSLG